MTGTLELTATTVAIETASDARCIHGSTANASAESANPGLLPVTFRRGATMHRRVSAARRFGEAGVPLVDGALANFECTVAGMYPFGANDVGVGAILREQPSHYERNVLVYFAGTTTSEYSPLACS